MSDLSERTSRYARISLLVSTSSSDLRQIHLRRSSHQTSRPCLRSDEKGEEMLKDVVVGSEPAAALATYIQHDRDRHANEIT